MWENHSANCNCFVQYGKAAGVHQHADEGADNYSNLRIVLHSETIKQLEAVQELLANDVSRQIKANLFAVKELDSTHGDLVASILETKTDYTASTPGGTQRAERVDVQLEVLNLEACLADAGCFAALTMPC